MGITGCKGCMDTEHGPTVEKHGIYSGNENGGRRRAMISVMLTWSNAWTIIREEISPAQKKFLSTIRYLPAFCYRPYHINVSLLFQGKHHHSNGKKAHTLQM